MKGIADLWGWRPDSVSLVCCLGGRACGVDTHTPSLLAHTCALASARTTHRPSRPGPPGPRRTLFLSVAGEGVGPGGLCDGAHDRPSASQGCLGPGQGRPVQGRSRQGVCVCVCVCPVCPTPQGRSCLPLPPPPLPSPPPPPHAPLAITLGPPNERFTSCARAVAHLFLLFLAPPPRLPHTSTTLTFPCCRWLTCLTVVHSCKSRWCRA